MPVIDPGAIAGIIADLSVSVLTYAGIAALLYSIGGILIRTIGWTFDKLLIGFIGSFYKYFETIINGELLTDSVVKGMMDRVYLLVGVFVVFRLGMLLFNYMLNPSEVMDEKLGVNALIKRVVLGLILIIFMPNIFEFAFRIQKAILDDQVIERVIMPEDDMIKVKSHKEKHGMGKIIGMTIFKGFFSVSSNGSSESAVTSAYDKALDINGNYDLSGIDGLGVGLDSGILYKSGGEYAFDYFPIFSTVVLGYILYLLIQYCLDAVVRSFKLSVLQVIAPICIVEYMINGDRNEVFKSWRKAVIATFAMLFMRVASIWFVAFVTMLMQKGASGIASDSLLQDPDNLLKAVIVLGLLAFMMDFPKLMSDVFGLDLDQSGSVKNVMGKAMGAATAGLAIGGAAVGAMAKPMKGALNVGKAGLTSALGNTKMGQKLGAWNDKVKSATTIKGNGRGAQAMRAMQERAKQEHVGTALKTGALAMGSAILASNAITKSAAGGYQQTSRAVDDKVSSQQSKEEHAVEQAATAAYRQHQMQQSEMQTEEMISQSIALGVDQNIASVAVKSRVQGLKDAGIDVDASSVIGNLKSSNQKLDNISTNTQVTADNTVHIKDNTKVISDNSSDSLVEQAAANKKLDNISTNTQITADNTVHIKDNTKVVADSTTNIEQNINTMVTQNETMNTTLNRIEGNTFATGIDSLNHMEDSGYIPKAPKGVNDSKPKVKDDDIETL